MALLVKYHVLIIEIDNRDTSTVHDTIYGDASTVKVIHFDGFNDV